MEEIGRGSFATVYKAVHVVSSHGSILASPTEETSMNSLQHHHCSSRQRHVANISQSQQKEKTLVAIKSVNLSKLNKKLKDNLTSEITILKGLHHPHIVALIDCKESSQHIHLVMEYVALGDLSYFIKKRDTIKDNPMVSDMMVKYPNPRVGGLNEVVVRHFLKQLASALQFLRVRNLIHRDVKPQNLLLNPSPHYFAKEKPSVMPYLASNDSLVPVCGIPSLPMLKIADFGFARSLPSTSLAETLCGSPLYMAPEILRYEKYDAKADLWSVGTVLYEMMTGKPPFRASNHVELLRRIEKGEDKIKFGDDVLVSDGMKKIVRSLLKRDPKERMSFPDFFANSVIVDEIPGLAPEDRPLEKAASSPAKEIDRRKSSQTDPTGLAPRANKNSPRGPYSESPRSFPQDHIPDNAKVPARQSTGPSSRPDTPRRNTGEDLQRQASDEDRKESRSPERPSLPSHATAPGRQELLHQNPQPAAVVMDRQASRTATPPTPSLIREQWQDREREQAIRRQEEMERERVAQDIAFERDYVVVEKKAVEVNALADELEASPRLHRVVLNQALSPQSGAMVRRATTQGTPASTTGAQTSASRAVQIASGRPRTDVLHHRQSSYERRYGPSPTSTTSAISKALNMASGRLFGVGFSPPISLGRGGRSPPIGYSPFPAYPSAQGSLVLVGDNAKPIAVDEDTKLVQSIEEVATRSDVVYGFAEVKYRQLIPTLPSAQTGLGLRRASLDARASEDGPSGGDYGLTVEATVIVSEEALVLYVKALSLLAKSMDIAGGWWARKNHGEVLGDSIPPRSTAGMMSPATGNRMNNVVQWVRSRFNEVLEKAELVRLRLIDSQKRLPMDHPSHPSNQSATTASSGGMGTSVDHVVVSSGVTAEKLMYDRALEMSRSAAIHELTGEDLPGCEISYVTAIRMLEAILENDDDLGLGKVGSSSVDKDAKSAKEDESPINGMEAEDRKTVKNRKCFLENILASHVQADIYTVVSSIRARLTALKKKLQVIQKRASAPAIGSPARGLTPRPIIPAIATTPPK
jgi:serine/threonine-protein kinase ULK/ATG1